jgi:murein DD-endopeptidase MepM/ murein hydrolase activator NlpD
MYVHVIYDRIVEVGDRVKAGDHIGHPTCENSPLLASGTHTHIARKYNGEWISTRNSVRFVMDGWVVHAGEKPYQGTMVQGGETTVIANPFGPSSSWIMRLDDIKHLPTLK